MECAICFEEKKNFKLLQCDHVFCEKCIEDLSMGKATKNLVANLKSSSKIDESSLPVENIGQIECPKCRRITKATVSQLPTKYFGYLRCTQCDEEKSIDEFRWCHPCSTSICSRCYIDKHINTSSDGKILGLHEASKWDLDYPAVRFCLEQIRLETENIQETSSKAKQYVKSYLEGLQEYMFVDIEQKTKATLNDYRQKMTTLSDAFGIDLRTIQPAISLNRSYQSMMTPLYDLSGRQARAINFHKQKYKLNSVAYKDLARHLLGTEKIDHSSNIFFDPSNISRKLRGESIIIGSNIIKQPSDLCLISNMENENSTKIILISDFESGLFLFKLNTLQLQGPLQLKQSYTRYARISTLGESTIDGPQSATGLADPTFQIRKSKNTILMVTCQGPGGHGHWIFILINISADGNKIEHMKINNNHHFSIPGNENLHINSSKRSLFGLSSTASQNLYRFNGLDDLRWKELHTVAPHGNPKPYCRIGPICDYTDHTEVLITNGAWQSIDILKFGWPDDRLWSVQRIEMINILPTNAACFSEPALFPCFDAGTDRGILIDKKQSILYIFERSNRKAFELAQFTVKLPQKILFFDANSLLLLVQHKDNQQARSLELYA